MIKHLKRKDIDIEKWDRCVNQSFNGVIYAYSWYLDVVTENMWEALVEDDYIRVFPFFPKRKWGLKYVYQPFVCQQLGVISEAKLDAAKVDEFLQLLKKKYRLINIHLNIYNRVNEDAFKVQKRITYQMDLIPPYDTLRKAYRKNHKRNIKKAETYNLSVIKSIKPSEVIKIFKENRGKELENMSINYALYQKLINAAVFSGMCATYGVVNQQRELLAGAIFLFSHNRVIYSFAGANEEGKAKRAMFTLVDSFIKDHQGKNLVLDFEGSNDKNVAYFYSGFGANGVYYPVIQQNSHSSLFRFLMKKLKVLSF